MHSNSHLLTALCFVFINVFWQQYVSPSLNELPESGWQVLKISPLWCHRQVCDHTPLLVTIPPSGTHSCPRFRFLLIMWKEVKQHVLPWLILQTEVIRVYSRDEQKVCVWRINQTRLHWNCAWNEPKNSNITKRKAVFSRGSSPHARHLPTARVLELAEERLEVVEGSLNPERWFEWEGREVFTRRMIHIGWGEGAAGSRLPEAREGRGEGGRRRGANGKEERWCLC